ncbi:MAG TPA: NepR family anti-sigma factor [Allosphingosinicella sp.]|nr:NepR family anti-sigma factor [Allosphingosinicella sp.]
MIFEDDQEGDRHRKSVHAAEPDTDDRPRSRTRKRTNSPEIGHALRNVYQRAVEEDIPPEMLDLLGKLG